MLSSSKKALNVIWVLGVSALMLLSNSAFAAGDDFDARGDIGFIGLPSAAALAVGFYSPACPACEEALPKWREFRKRFKKQGVAVVLFQPLERNERCLENTQVLEGFTVICDVGGVKSKSLGYKSNIEKGHLWSWQGEILTASATVASLALQTQIYLDN